MSVTPFQLGDAINQLFLKASPILFCDTCILLDIIRIPSRVSSPDECSRILTAVQSIIDKAERGEISLVIPPPVESEWQTHASKTKEETKTHLKKLQLQFEVLQIVNQQRGQAVAHTNISTDEVADYLYNLSESILKKAIHLAKDDSVSLRATNRASGYIAPASKGAINDCLLYEHSLHIMTELRKQAFVPPFVFATSNTTDFCEGHKPKPRINTELESVGATLCTAWYWAYRTCLQFKGKSILLKTWLIQLI